MITTAEVDAELQSLEHPCPEYLILWAQLLRCSHPKDHTGPCRYLPDPGEDQN